MPSFTAIAKLTGKFLSDHSPVILTGVAVAGTITTAIVAVKATPQAISRIEEAEEKKQEPLTQWEKVKVTWLCYVPAAAICGVTVSCIVGATSINMRRNAALISAYTITETAFREYQDKVVDSFGATKEQKVRDEIVQDRVTDNPPSDHDLYIIEGETQVTCYDHLSGRYFKSTKEALSKAMNDINYEVIQNMYATVNDFWGLIGLRPLDIGDEFGWSHDLMLELDFSSALDPKSVPVLAIHYRTEPIRSFNSHSS